jgi:ABC-type multidrug transport system ATPase subunit
MAIMGSSGAGKTTCLDILAGKTKRGIVSGDLLINGKVPTREQFKRISGYVDQEVCIIIIIIIKLDIANKYIALPILI